MQYVDMHFWLHVHWTTPQSWLALLGSGSSSVPGARKTRGCDSGVLLDSFDRGESREG